MGSVVHSVTNVVKSSVNAVAAPIKVVSDVASGKNVVSSVGSGVNQAVAGVLGGSQGMTLAGASGVIDKTPILNKVVKALPYSDNALKAGDSLSDAGAAGGFTPESARTAAGNNLALAGYVGAGYGASLAVPAMGLGSVTTGEVLAGGAVAKSLLSGNPNLALTTALDSQGYDTSALTDFLGANKQVVTPIGAANLGPYPDRTIGNVQASPIASSTNTSISPIVLGVGAIAIWYFFIR